MHRKHTTAEDGMQNARSVSHSGKTLRRRLSFRPVAVIAAAFAALLTTGLVAGPLAGVSGAVTPHALTTTALGYTPLASPVRIADTRAGAVDPATYAGKTLAQGTGLTVDVPSADIPATASAVVVNITAISPANAGFLSVFPGGGTNPGTANVTFAANQNVGDQVTVGLGPDSATSSTQSFTVYDGPATGGGSVDFAADLVGYYLPQTATAGGGYNPLTPARIYDSRAGSGQTGAGTTLTNGGSATVKVTGVGGVPATATAVVLNVAITNATASSFITAYPAGQTQPGTASQNFLAGETLSSQVIAAVGAGGSVTIANHAGNVDLVVDVNGYYGVAGGTGSLLTVLSTPVRLTDTRPAGIAGGASVTAAVQGAGATAGVLSVADIATPGNGNFLTAYPAGTTAPLAATVNYVPGDTYNIVENAAYATTNSTGGVAILNGPANAATANVVVDEDGYFAPTSTPVNGTSVFLSATPGSVVANGSTSALTATVTNATTGPVSGDIVTFTGTGVCGTITPASATTSATGVASATYTSSSSAGNCTITATEGTSGAASNGSVVTQTALPTTYHTAVAATPAQVNTTGLGNTSTIIVTVTGPGNTPITGDQVEVFASNATASTLNTCGTFVTGLVVPPGTNPDFGTTGAGGQVTFTYTSGTLIGACTISATEANQATSGTATVTQVLQGYSITDAANPTGVIANGVLTTTITATVLHNGTPANADPVTFTLGASSPIGACGTLPAVPTVNTNTAGLASITYTSPLLTGAPSSSFCPVSATEALGGSATAVPAVVDNQGGSPANVIQMNATPNSIAAGSTSAVTATVTGASNSGIVGDEVAFSVSGGCTITPPVFLATGALGATTAVTVNGLLPGTCTVTGTESNSGRSGSTTITVNPVVNSVAVAATPSILTANGTTTSQVTATVTGPSAAGDTVTFAALSPTGGLCGSLPATGVIVNSSGQAVVTYTSSSSAGFCIITATEAATAQHGSTQVDQTII